ncbi:hypothetical protein [Singulisphaera sp. PoT]|uniref:hypothetical protein n=1 Tax=Singulisphaera sp. PoT TaxID=3411797 RepID=UPI003BF4A0E2
MKRFGPGILVVLTLVVVATRATSMAEESRPRYEKRWVYAAPNLAVEESVDDILALIGRSRKAGYNGMILADYKFNILDRMHPGYLRNVRKVVEAAADLDFELIPAVFPIGYSEGLLAHDPNLAEGLPVVDAPFVVNGPEARLVEDPDAGYKNGGLEDVRGDRFAGFSFQDDPGKTTFADRATFHGGHVSCRIEDPGKGGSAANARLIQRLAVRPHSAYRFSCWVKTRDYKAPGSFHLTVLGAAESARPLTFHEAEIRPNQDWTQVDVVFNTLDQESINAYVGVWGVKTGTLWVDDIKLEPLGFVNILRRDGCPLSVISDDGRTRYEEGKDFEPIVDPKLGVVPYAGLYDFGHAGPSLRLTSGSRIKDGAKLKVSWYHPVPIHGGQLMCCLSDPKLDALLKDQARRVNDLFHPRAFLMSHDEIRVANWCKACQDRHASPGELLARNVKRCAAILKEVAPRSELLVWSDMFDPFHNARKDYYLVNGSLEGSWKGLDPQITILNWNGEKSKESLNWFAKLGHRQIIAGYYDADDLSGFSGWNEAAKGVRNIHGFLYTTWQKKYGQLESYGEAIRKAGH